jgi:hypothetical protein
MSYSEKIDKLADQTVSKIRSLGWNDMALREAQTKIEILNAFSKVVGITREDIFPKANLS